MDRTCAFDFVFSIYVLRKSNRKFLEIVQISDGFEVGKTGCDGLVSRSVFIQFCRLFE